MLLYHWLNNFAQRLLGYASTHTHTHTHNLARSLKCKFRRVRVPAYYSNPRAITTTPGRYASSTKNLTPRMSTRINHHADLLEARTLLSGQAVSIIDDGDTGFVKTGNWTTSTLSSHAGDGLYSAKGNGSDKATWSFTNIAPGIYRVSTSWSQHPNRASNAPYTIRTGDGTILATALVNQKAAPSGLSDANTNWHDLATVTITGSSLTIELTDKANGYVIADAIRLECLSLTNQAPVFDQDNWSFSIDENTVGSLGTISASDVNNDTLTYSLVGNNPNFTIDASTGALSLVNPYNYETQNGQPVQLTLEVTDGNLTVTSTVQVTINNINEAPEFDTHTENTPDINFIDSEPGDYVSTSLIGILHATDPDGDQLTYYGNYPAFIDISSNGDITITNQDDFLYYFEQNESLTITVYVTDGEYIVESNVTINPFLGIGLIPSRYMYVKDSNGTEYYPVNSTELKNVFLQIKQNNRQIELMVIKGHGGFDGTQVGPGEDYLTITNSTIYVGDHEVTQVLKDITNNQSKIYLRACFSKYVAKPLALSLDGARVWGAQRYVINIPGTSQGLYAWRSYQKLD